MDMLRRFINSLVDLIYPKACILCKKKTDDKAAGDNSVCFECWMKAKRNLPPFCCCCGRHLEKAHFYRHICPGCVRGKLHFDRAFSPFVYESAMKELIHEFKYKNKRYLGKILGSSLVEFIKEYSLPIDYIDFIVPVPLHKTKLREREFNQAQILGSYIAKEFKKDSLSGNLLRHRHTKTQTDLGTNERFLNMKGSFSVVDPALIKQKNLLLVDDVLTSGATCSEAAFTLKKSGANIVFVLTLAN